MKIHSLSAVKDSKLQNTQPSFGYNFMTHKVITQKAIKQVPELKRAAQTVMQDKIYAQKLIHKLSIVDIVRAFEQHKNTYKKLLNTHAMHNVGMDMLLATPKKNLDPGAKFLDEITNGSMMPDLLRSEIGFGTNSHFYFPPEGRFKSQSFGLHHKENNALVSFLKHISNAFEMEKSPDLPQELGMALHFIQDVTVPMHTQRANIKIFKNSPVLGKIVDFMMHAKFENNRNIGMVARHKELLKSYTPGYEKLRNSLPENYTLRDIFMSNVQFSTQPELQIARTNKAEWNQIQQKIFDRAVDSTVLVLEKYAQMLG